MIKTFTQDDLVRYIYQETTKEENISQSDFEVQPPEPKKKKIKSCPPNPTHERLTKNRKKIDVVVGMYHDQVLTPLKTLYEYDAINITLGLPFIRISPDHGPNEKMLGMNKSNPTSLLRSIQFLDQN